MNTGTWYHRFAPAGQSRSASRLTGRAAGLRFTAKTVFGLLACGAIVVAVSACSSASAAKSTRPKSASAVIGRPAPANWGRVTLPGGGAVLAYPPSMRLLGGDKGTVSAASFSPSGKYLLYLNVTPKQGAESLSNFVEFRLDHQREEETPAVRELSERTAVRFLGGTGTCVTDAYVTKVGANHFTEIACFVRGRTAATVLVAAAPSATWASAAGVLRRAIAAFTIR
jgi:hypothetical protein